MFKKLFAVLGTTLLLLQGIPGTFLQINRADAVTYRPDMQEVMSRKRPIYLGNQYPDTSFTQSTYDTIPRFMDIVSINKNSDLFVDKGANVDIANKLRSIIPGVKVLQYLNLLDVWDWSQTYTWMKDNKAFLYDDNGKVLNTYYNVHRFAGDPLKIIWQDYFANRAASIASSGMDGIFSDNWFRTNAQNWAINSARFASIQSGWETIGQKVKSKMGSGKILFANGLAYPTYQARDVSMIEMRNAPNATAFNYYLKMSDQSDSYGQANADTISWIFDGSTYMRSYDSILGFSLPACLLTNNIFGFSNDQKVFDIIKKAGKIGYPLGNRYRANNVLQRDYTEGKVIFNDTAGTVTVPVAAGFKNLDGNSVTSVTLGSFRGIILKGAASVAPAAPSNLTASASKGATTGNYYVNLTWQDNATNETGYVVYQSVNSTTNFTQVATISANSKDYAVNLGTSPTTGTYYYTVKAVNNGTFSNSSNTASCNITTPPAAPSGLTVTGVSVGAATGNYYVNLSWQDNSTNETGFELYQSVNSTDDYRLIKTPAANTKTFSANIGSNPTSGTYYYKMKAVNSVGTSDDSNVTNTKIGSTPPAAPSDLTVTGVSKGATTGDYYVSLSWQDNSTDETGFELYQSINSTDDYRLIKTSGANTKSFSVNVGSNPVPGNYYYKIKAVNSDGSSDDSNATNTAIGVAAPSNLTITQSYKGSSSGHYYVGLKWQNNATNYTSLQILDSVGSANNFQVVKNPAVGVASYSVDVGTKPDTYYFQIKAVNGTDVSQPSNTVSKTLY